MLHHHVAVGVQQRSQSATRIFEMLRQVANTRFTVTQNLELLALTLAVDDFETLRLIGSLHPPQDNQHSPKRTEAAAETIPRPRPHETLTVMCVVLIVKSISIHGRFTRVNVDVRRGAP